MEDLQTEIEITEENIKEIEEFFGAIPEELAIKPETHEESEAIKENVDETSSENIQEN